jgi:hypothetical protein
MIVAPGRSRFDGERALAYDVKLRWIQNWFSRERRFMPGLQSALLHIGDKGALKV